MAEILLETKNLVKEFPVNRKKIRLYMRFRTYHWLYIRVRLLLW